MAILIRAVERARGFIITEKVDTETPLGYQKS
jgi:hypothetical protein